MGDHTQNGLPMTSWKDRMTIGKDEISNQKPDQMAEWLRRWTANPLGSARAGSNPVLVVVFRFYSVVGYHARLWISEPEFESP